MHNRAVPFCRVNSLISWRLGNRRYLAAPPLPTGAGVLAQLGPGKVAVDHLSNGTFPQRQAKQRFEH
jgi:hypothetical protein